MEPDIKQEFDRTIDYLYSFINLEHKRLDRYQASKLDPTRIGRFLALMASPQQQFPSIHIAGTKGKGSVAALCAAALRMAGLKVGLYTSPHIQDFRERIRILTPEDADGRIPEAAFVHIVNQQIRPAVAQIPDVTWFEILTAVAFYHFAAERVDVAVVEVGLGGRLDATNVVTPLVSVITSLSLDHTYFLGNTLTQIAYEKGGIIKPGVPVVTAVQPAEALTRLQEIAAGCHAPLTQIGRDYTYICHAHGPWGNEITVQRADGRTYEVHVPLAGEHQQLNAAVALAALHIVQPYFPTLTDTAVAQGMAQATWRGRLEIIHQAADTPTLLVDCAHNVDSAIKLAHALTHEYRYGRLFLIFAISADKDAHGMIAELFPIADEVIITVSTHPRALPLAELVAQATQEGFAFSQAPDVQTAVAHAWCAANPQDLICVTGSIFIVGDLLNQWDALKSRLCLTSD